MKKLSKKALSQFLKYNLGGLAYFWSAWAIITFSTSKLGSVQAYLLGNFVGMLLNYLVQKFIAFGESNKTILSSGWKYVFITILNLGIGYILLQLLVGIGLELWLAQFGNAAFFTVWNWYWYKTWVFSAELQVSKRNSK